FDDRESFHRLNRDRFLQWQFAQACHAHELRYPVHFCRARTTLSRLAIPSARKIRRLRPLNIMHRIEHNHAFGDFGRVILKLTALCVASPDFERGCRHKTWSDVSGVRTLVACWRTSPGVRELFFGGATLRGNKG